MPADPTIAPADRIDNGTVIVGCPLCPENPIACPLESQHTVAVAVENIDGRVSVTWQPFGLTVREYETCLTLAQPVSSINGSITAATYFPRSHSLGGQSSSCLGLR